MSNLTPAAVSATSFSRASRRAAAARSLALATCAGLAGLVGCGADELDPEAPRLPETGETDNPAGSAAGQAEAARALRLTVEAQAAARPEDPAQARDRAAFAAELTAQAARGQAYLDTKVAPRLDLALRATSGLTYAQLQAEAAAATTAADPEAAVQAFFTARGAAIEAAVAHLGTTTAALGEEVRLAAQGDRPAASAEAAPPMRTFGACSAGHEFEPFPPYFEAGNWFIGVNSATLPTVNVSGAIRSEANLIVGGTTQVGGWVRADNVPPTGAGTTQVSTSVFFSTALSELILWVPSYAGSGVGLNIEIFDRAAGTFLGSCRRPILDAAIPVGYQILNRSVVVSHACTVHRPASTMLMSRVNIEAYGTSAAPFGSVARAVGQAQVESIRFMTCLD